MNAKSILLVVAGVLFFLGLALTVEVAYFLSVASSAEGKVVSLEKRTSGSGWRYYADVTFRDGNNITHTVNYSYITTPLVSLLSTGREIGVLYSADDPAGSARLDFFPILWFWPGVLIIAGLVAVFLAWRASHQPAPAPPRQKTVQPKSQPPTR